MDNDDLTKIIHVPRWMVAATLAIGMGAVGAFVGTAIIGFRIGVTLERIENQGRVLESLAGKVEAQVKMVEGATARSDLVSQRVDSLIDEIKTHREDIRTLGELVDDLGRSAAIVAAQLGARRGIGPVGIDPDTGKPLVPKPK